jgi:peptidoglycan hydrolase CwlO-like protein
MIDRLNAIEASFYKHKEQIPLIDCDKYDEAMKQIEEIRLKFEDDKDNLLQLINEIESALMDQKSEKNKRIFQAVVSGVVGLASGVAGGLTKGSNKVEYSFASIFSGINTVANTIDVVKLQSNIKEYKNILNRARSLENKIKEQIDILNKKYRAIQKSDLPDIYK